MKKIFILLAVTSFALHAENIPVKESLATLVENAVIETNLNINILSQTNNSININQVNGIGVCEAAAKENVLKLQKALISNINAKQVYSMYEAYIRNTKTGKVSYLNANNPQFTNIVNGCINLYVSVK